MPLLNIDVQEQPIVASDVLPTFEKSSVIPPLSHSTALRSDKVGLSVAQEEKKSASDLPLLDLFLAAHSELDAYKAGQTSIEVDGQSLSVPAVNFISRYPHLYAKPLSSSASDSSDSETRIHLSSSKALHATLRASRAALDRKLAQNKSIYGVSTGFGGSADTRTREHSKLGLALLQHQHGGVLPVPKTSASYPNGVEEEDSSVVRRAEPLMDPYATLTMPLSIVRGALLVRANSLARGHSAVRAELIDGRYRDESSNQKGASLLTLLEHDIVPLVPLRGSISASGDLSPLSYVAGTLIGERSIRVSVPSIDSTAQNQSNVIQSRQILPAPNALSIANLKPLTLMPKEHLGILNGTAFSAAAAALCVYEASVLGVLCETLTALGTEALLGCAGNYARFIADVRPHAGQREVSDTIRKVLRGSKFISGEHSERDTVDGETGGVAVKEAYEFEDEEEEETTIDKDTGVLRQDRYPLRTAPQFLGPQFEEVVRAWSVVGIEVNSTTDNPLISPTTGHVHHGGNFQAMSVTNALDPLRAALAHMGRLLFAQSTELTNSAMNRGLTANLAATDASLNFFGKGLDIAVASYSSELGYLAGNVGVHVRSAEMGNQAVNSLALISARYTLQALDVLSLLSATYLYLLCQAVDLRALNRELREEVGVASRKALKEAFPALYQSQSSDHFEPVNTESSAEQSSQLNHLEQMVEEAAWNSIEANANADTVLRMQKAAQAAGASVVEWFIEAQSPSTNELQLSTRRDGSVELDSTTDESDESPIDSETVSEDGVEQEERPTRLTTVPNGAHAPALTRDLTPDLVNDLDSPISPLESSGPSTVASSRDPSSTRAPRALVRLTDTGAASTVPVAATTSQPTTIPSSTSTTHQSISKDLTLLSSLPLFITTLTNSYSTSLQSLREAYLQGSRGPAPAAHLLGAGTRELYLFVRSQISGTSNENGQKTGSGLGVPMHGSENLFGFEQGLGQVEESIGERVSRIYEAIRDGRIADVLVKVVNA